MPLFWRWENVIGLLTHFFYLQRVGIKSNDKNLFWCNFQDDEEDEKAVIGFWGAFTWLVGMTIIIAVLSEYVVGTIEV